MGPSVSRLVLDALSFLQGEVFLRNPKAEGCLGFLLFPKVRRVAGLATLKSFALVSEDQGLPAGYGPDCPAWPGQEVLSNIGAPDGWTLTTIRCTWSLLRK